MVELCQGPDPHSRQPRLPAPPLATDTHFHILGRPARVVVVIPCDTPDEKTRKRILVDNPAALFGF